jgi:hypothetical protein
MKMELAENVRSANITIIEQRFRRCVMQARVDPHINRKRCLSGYCTYSPAGESRWNDERLLLVDPSRNEVVQVNI